MQSQTCEARVPASASPVCLPVCLSSWLIVRLLIYPPRPHTRIIFHLYLDPQSWQELFHSHTSTHVHFLTQAVWVVVMDTVQLLNVFLRAQDWCYDCCIIIVDRGGGRHWKGIKAIAALLLLSMKTQNTSTKSLERLPETTALSSQTFILESQDGYLVKLHLRAPGVCISTVSCC